MKNLCLIKQPAGLGDIILCQKIVDALIDRDYHVYWPVIEQYLDSVKNYMQKDGITFCSEEDDFPLKEYYHSNFRVPIRSKDGGLYFPLQYADLSYPGESVLKAKFKILKMDSMGWQQHFKISRNTDKENELFYDVLGMDDYTDYAFVNLWYGSPPHSEKKDILIESKLHKIEMSTVDNFSIFDWCKVIENAFEIYCVDTSLFYIIEFLELKANKLEAYSKFSPSNYMHIDGLFSKSWRYN